MSSVYAINAMTQVTIFMLLTIEFVEPETEDMNCVSEWPMKLFCSSPLEPLDDGPVIDCIRLIGVSFFSQTTGSNTRQPTFVPHLASSQNETHSVWPSTGSAFFIYQVSSVLMQTRLDLSFG